MVGHGERKPFEYLLQNSQHVQELKWLDNPFTKKKKVLQDEVTSTDVIILTSLEAAEQIIEMIAGKPTLLLLTEIHKASIQKLLEYGFAGIMTLHEFILNPEDVILQLYLDQIVYGDDLIDGLFSYLSQAIVPDMHLTERETEIMRLLSRGGTYSEIGQNLEISIETVKTHVRRIYSKLKVNNKSEAIMKAIQCNLI